MKKWSSEMHQFELADPVQGRSKSSSDDAIFLHLVVECDTTGHIPVSEPLVSQVKNFQGGIQCLRRQNLILFWPPTYLPPNESRTENCDLTRKIAF